MALEHAEPKYEIGGEELCEHESMTYYEPFVAYSCIKLMSEHRMEFLKAFEGESGSDVEMMKGSIYNKMKDVIIDVYFYLCH